MFRSLLALLALLVPGLALLFDRPWLNVVTVVIVVGGLGLLGWWLYTAWVDEEREPPEERPQSTSSSPEPSLDEMGIVDIQPKGAATQTTADTSDPSSPTESEDASPNTSPATASPAATSSHVGRATPARESDTGVQSPDAPVFAPLLEAVRAAIDARTVCLLVQEEVALTYRIEALASTHSAAHPDGSFDTQTPLLTATMSREAVTLRSLAEEKVAVEDLGYYDDPPAVHQLAVAPVSRPDAPSTTFLLADAPAADDLGSSRARSLLKHFADTISVLYNTDRSAAASALPENGDPPDPTPEAPSDTSPEETSPKTADDAPRPRRELIAEEMSAADEASEELSLALVHLNRAESIARRGEEAVASAERLFQARLEQMAPRRRVERFGELTYGIFFRDGADTVESWVADLETVMAKEQGELEGGASVGAAVWTRSHEDPETLRTEATRALREAYETGTCTIVT